MPQQADAAISAKYVIPVIPSVVLQDHSLVISQGRILDLVPTRELADRYTVTEHYDRPDHILIPGLINAHTHMAMTLFRGIADDLPLREWLEGHIWPAEKEWVGPDFVRDGTALAIAEMLRGGTTCASDMYFYPEISARTAASMGMRAVIGMPILEIETAWAASAEECFSKGLEVHDAYRGHPLVTVSFAPHAPYTVSDSALKRIRTLADELELPVHMHVHETLGEINDAVAARNERPMERLRRLGLASRQLVAVHMTCLNEADLAIASEGNINVVHCPESNMKLASGICPAPRLLELGINVCLGTDGAASNNDLSMFGEMKAAAMLGKVSTGDPSAVPASTILEMATINGARALGLEEQTGSLEPGKWADICCVDTRKLHMQPLYDPISQIVYCAERGDVNDVWVAGRHLLDNGHLLNASTANLIDSAASWGSRLAEYGVHREGSDA